MIKKTIGGERLGSGNRMKAELHNYERSTHNLGNAFRTTAAPGVLIPFYKKLALNGDTWTIDLNTLVRTMPAIGPLLGAYKLQLDMFEIPIRLYQGVLHNNWTRIGMDMGKVKLPKIEMESKWIDPDSQTIEDYNTYQISSSSLMAYLGVRGIGGVVAAQATGATEQIKREFNAVPILAYYDIFKNYYANKQEKKAFVISTTNTTASNTMITRVEMMVRGSNHSITPRALEGNSQELPTTDAQQIGRNFAWIINGNTQGIITISNGLTFKIYLNGEIEKGSNPMQIVLVDENGNEIYEDITNGTHISSVQYGENYIEIVCGGNGVNTYKALYGFVYNSAVNETGEIRLQDFDLENIDLMRRHILRNTDLNTSVSINSADLYPYKAIYQTTASGNSYSKFKMVGLCLKSYQSDLFNNWLSSEWIDGINGINAITAVNTASGSFTIDALNLANKVYNMLNRIAVSGGTYQDWQEAVYGEDAVRMAESPIYCGGLSAKIAFEEVVSTADTNTDTAGDQPLGTLAGKGTLLDIQGGEIEIHPKEPSYIMGIMSITPYIDYSQGNDFDMTELDSINDIHKPALDQIGFQNLLLERAAWWGTEYNPSNNTWITNAVGKVPAWVEYMTSFNQIYGDFARMNELGFMCLNRNYEVGQGLVNGTNQVIPVQDFTTYINPSKYNYQFANTELDAQNFWVQIGINAIARRKMSAKIIPNL